MMTYTHGKTLRNTSSGVMTRLCVLIYFFARNRNGVLKSEIELLYPRLPLTAVVTAGYSQFSRRNNFGYYRFR